MKRLTALLLISFHLIQISGPFLLREYLQFKTDRFFNEQASRGRYNKHDLTEIRIPVNMPGITDWQRYQNVSGQIQFDHTCYNYVKMKMTRNYMYLMCIPNYDKTRLTSENVINAKGIKEIPVPKKNHVPAEKTTLTPAYNFSFIQFVFNAPVKELTRCKTLSVQKTTFQSQEIPEQPPKATC